MKILFWRGWKKRGWPPIEGCTSLRSDPYLNGPRSAHHAAIDEGEVSAALTAIKHIYKADFKHAKAGVMLLDLQPDSFQQTEVELEGDRFEDRGKLMSALEGLNQRYGKGTVLMASAGADGNRRIWSMKQERRTPG
jgi:hypothetical protein